MKKKTKYILSAVVVVLIIAGSMMYMKMGFMLITRVAPSMSLEELSKSISQDSIPKFREIQSPFTHKLGKQVPFTGSALIDVDSDGVDEVFIGGGKGQDDALLKFKNGKFENIIQGTELSNKTPDFATISLDVDDDGDTDLIIAKPDGVHIRLNNHGAFTDSIVSAKFDTCAVPFGLGAGDINKDGYVDLYVATFKCPAGFKPMTFNNPAVRSQNVVLLNNGDNTFRDITKSSGLAFNQNTFMGTFVDLDGDGWQDVVVVPNTDTVHIYKNNHNDTFTEMQAPTKNGFWMGMSTGDIDNDGDTDLFFSNTGITIPASMGRGDLHEDQSFDPHWSLLRNDGDFKFTEVHTARGLDGYEFGWGADFADLNLDSRKDLLVSENFVKLPAHKLKKLPGRVLLQDQSGKFLPAGKVMGASNPHYGMTPLVSDFNSDGYPDIVYVNITEPTRVLLNNGGKNHYLAVDMPDAVRSIGAVVTVKTANHTLSQQFVVGTGLLSDQSSKMIFGLGDETRVRSLEIAWPDGEKRLFEGVRADSVVAVR